MILEGRALVEPGLREAALKIKRGFLGPVRGDFTEAALQGAQNATMGKGVAFKDLFQIWEQAQEKWLG